MTAQTPQEQPDGHTKGPWRVEGQRGAHGIIVSHGLCPERDGPAGYVCVIDPMFASAAARSFKADARLMITAPEIADALKLALQHIEHQAAWIAKTNASDKPLHGYSFEALGEDMPGMRAAIAKALGQ